MRRFLIISLVILAICLVGCEEKKTEEVVINSGENQTENKETIGNNVFNMSFEERTKEAKEFINKGFVSHASIEKQNDYYVMKIQISSSKLFDKEEIENAYNLAQENGTYILDGRYTFYKDNEDIVKTQAMDREMVLGLIENIEGYVATHPIDEVEDYIQLCAFRPTVEDNTKYDCENLTYAGGSGLFYETEIIKEIEVVLLPSDLLNIKINQPSDENDINMTVEEFYNKGINKENIELSGYSDFQVIDLNNIGNSRDTFATTQDAVEFKDVIVINYTIGGV